MRQQGNGALNEFNERVEIAVIRESLSLANGPARWSSASSSWASPPTSRRRDVTNYRAVLKFVGGFDDRVRQRQHDYLTYATPSFVTANARSKEQACLLLAEPTIRCDNSALYVTERVRHLTPENTWLR